MTTSFVKDIPLLIQSAASSSERRITPTWTITQLKQKLEPITGIPPSAQTLILRLPEQDLEHRIQADDEDAVRIGKWPLVAYAEIEVCNINHNRVFPVIFISRSASAISLFSFSRSWQCLLQSGETKMRESDITSARSLFPDGFFLLARCRDVRPAAHPLAAFHKVPGA